MLLETTVEATLTGAPAWLEALLAMLAGVLTTLGYKVAVKPKAVAKAAAPVALVLLALSLTGCAGAVQKAALRDSLNSFEPVVHDLEQRAGATESERLANQKQLNTMKKAVE